MIPGQMHKGRLEAFSDAVIAIAMTVMVLELKPPAGTNVAGLLHLWPSFACYVLSFVFLAIYWNNHHHMLQVAKHVNGGVLWANQHLLFWLSLIPFVTSWMGENSLAPWPVSLYGVDLLMCGVAYYILTRTLLIANRDEPEFALRLGSDFKGKISVVIYAVAIALSWVNPAISCGIYFFVALMWLVPDRRFEPNVHH